MGSVSLRVQLLINLALLFNCPTPGHLHPSVSWAVGGHSPARVFLSRSSQPQGFQSLWAPHPPELRAVGIGWARAGPVGADHRSPKLVDTSVGSRHASTVSTLGAGRSLGAPVQASMVTTVF